MNVVIIKYNAGNICSVDYALRRLGIEPIITAAPEIIRKADKVIFPGQGEANSTMKYLRERNMDKLITSLKQPVLGICLGMQLMCRYSEEGNTDCLGIIDAEVKKFTPNIHEEKVPHMGWNKIYDTKTELFKGIESIDPYVYFVHSYYVPLNPYSINSTDYILPFCSALHRDNFYATQYHPEKSGKTGELILHNFLNL